MILIEELPKPYRKTYDRLIFNLKSDLSKKQVALSHFIEWTETVSVKGPTVAYSFHYANGRANDLELYGLKSVLLNGGE